jgi:hypothetical protein
MPERSNEAAALKPPKPHGFGEHGIYNPQLDHKRMGKGSPDWSQEIFRFALKAGDRTRTGDVQLGKLD